MRGLSSGDKRHNDCKGISPDNACRFAISMKISILIDIYAGGTTVEVRDVMGTEANVQGLTPGALYTFSVTAENAVSFQDIDITGRSTNTTATTEEGGRAAHECKLMAYIQQERSK